MFVHVVFDGFSHMFKTITMKDVVVIFVDISNENTVVGPDSSFKESRVFVGGRPTMIDIHLNVESVVENSTTFPFEINVPKHLDSSNLTWFFVVHDDGG